MLRLFDFECPKCGDVFERLIDHSRDYSRCDKCAVNAKKVISASGVYTANQDADWIKSVIEVVDKDSTAPHVLEFRKNPNRQNYQKWMAGQGLRPMAPGEEVIKREEVDLTQTHKEVWAKHRARHALEVRG